MEDSLHLLLFGDQTGDYRSIFRQVLHIKDNAFLTSFFEKAYSTLRDEVAQQPRAVRDQIPGFTSITDLVARYSDSTDVKSNALESALTCISQIACFICHQGTLSENYPTSSKTRIIGSCTGLLAAAAVSSSQSLVELLPAAVEAVRIAFRIGVVVTEVRDEIEQRAEISPSWSAVISGIEEPDANSILNRFHDENRISASSRAYVSAISPNALTISGPHLVLDQLFRSVELSKTKPLRLPIYGPYHAVHLFREDVLQSILRPGSEILESQTPKIPVLSTESGNWITVSTFGQMLDVVVRDVLVRPLHWEKVLESIASTVKESGSPRCTVLRLGPSNAGQSLVSALRQHEDIETSLDDRFIGDIENLGPEDSSGRLAHSKIAICGLSGRFPDAADHEAFWKLLEKGLDLHREVPKDRFNVETHVDADGKRTNTSHTPFGCFIENPGLFDPRFFGISPREATQTDPMQRLALVTAYEALEMSGYVPNRSPSTQLDRIGTFYGQTSDDWREIQAAQKVDTFFIPGGVRAFGPGRINFHFKFSGPSFNIDTACSSSLAAIQLACTSLWANDCDTAVAGGMNVLTNPDIFSGLSRGQFLSKKGPCQTFDNDADGYCRADGVGTVILKRLEDAEADKDPILGVILGSATNHSAEAVSITHPHAGAQEFLYKKVLNAAGVDPHDVSYVEMHGTGTQAGDATEMRSVTNAFAPENRRRHPDQKLHLGAVKANAGHGEAASGITSLIKVLMMMEKSIIPPHCGIKGTINRTFPKNLEERNVHIAFEPTPWIRPEGKSRRLFLNNFSAAGGNTALLLEDAPPPISREKNDPRSNHIVAVSAKSEFSLKENLKSLIAVLDESADLPSLSYTTTARRIQHNYRVAVAGPDIAKVKDALSSSIGQDISQIPTAKPKVAFVFTGQGSQYAAMGKQLFETSPQFKSNIKQYDAICVHQGFPSFQPLIDGSVSEIQHLSPVMVQLGAVCVQIALSKLLSSWGINPTVVVGHSLGEYAALYAAGVLSISDTISLVGQRAKLLEDKCQAGSHCMLAVKSSVASIGNLLEGSTFEIACINAPEETVVSGTNINIDLLSEELKERGLKSTKLTVPYAFHSAQVETILDDFETSAKGVTFTAPAVPVISPLKNDVIRDDKVFDPEYLRRHCRETVNFLGAMEAAKHSAVVDEGTLWVEIGCHPVCSNMIKSTFGSIKSTPTLRRNEDNWKVLTSSLCKLYSSGLNVDWTEYHREYDSNHDLLRLPTYKWDNKNYWIDYKNNWCLTKGDSTIAEEIPEPKSKLSNSSVHRIVEEDFNDEGATIIVESNLAEPELKEVIKGHEVNGLGLCPPSLYAEMALTTAEYIHKEWKPEVDRVAMNVCDMKVEKPLIAEDKEYQPLHVAGSANFVTGEVKFTYYSIDGEGKKTVTHALCGVKYEDSDTWLAGWARTQYMVNSRLDSLLNGVQNGDNHQIKRGMAYKLFGGLITYGAKYRGMEEVILNGAELEAASTVAFAPGAQGSNFFISPYIIDSVAHLSGFVMLGNESAEPSKEVYVSHGWQNCRFARPFSMEKKYRAYVKMQKCGGKAVMGDVYVFEENTIIAVVEGLEFHLLPRQLMDSILAATGGNSKTAAPSRPNTASKAKPSPKVSGTAKPTSSSKPKSPPKLTSPKKASGTVTAQAIGICAEEIGVAPSELLEEKSFAEMGVDSLLSLTVSGKFREVLDIEVPSTLFVDYPTVKDLKQYLAQFDSDETGQDNSVEAESLVSTEDASGSTTPVLETDSQSSVTSDEEIVDPKTSDGQMATMIRSTVAEELGVGVGEITASTDLGGLGMDSLMSLTVLGKLRESTGEDLPSDFFTEHATFGDIEKSFSVAPEPSATPKPQTNESSVKPEHESGSESKHANKSSPPATSVLMQGNPKTASRTLFLFPDGSGSATSYAQIPTISDDVAVYGLNCPFLKCPEDYTVGIPAVSTLYLAEVRRRQTHGPYLFGGWSAGGVIAYETAMQMIAQGEPVDRLILLDAPCPIRLEPLPSRLHHFFDSIGLLGPEGGHPDGPPPWLLPHFDHSIASLSAYKPSAMHPPDAAPQTFALWARDGVCKSRDDPRPAPERNEGEPHESASTTWLLYNRTDQDLQYNGWDRLIPTPKFSALDSVPDVNHFTLMRKGAGASATGAFLKRALQLD